MTKAATSTQRVQLSLEQFAAVEAWVEALFRYALKHQSDNHAPLLTDVYRHRQRAVMLLTGSAPPVDDEEAFRESIQELIREARRSSRAHSASVQPRKRATASDVDDPYDVG